MLTKQDLTQIGNLIDTKTRKIVQEEIDPLKKDVKSLKKDVSKLKKDVRVIISMFDREYIGLEKRVSKVEKHMGI